MSSDEAEDFIRERMVQHRPEAVMVQRVYWFSIQRTPFFILGVTPAYPFSLVWHFGVRSVAIGPHYVVKFERKKSGG